MDTGGYRELITSVFDRKKEPGSEWIPILDCGYSVGWLCPVTRDFRVALPGCAALFARWRNENPSLSDVPFTATPTGTARWLDEQVVGRADRLLFLILSAELEKVGHIGFSSFDFTERSCEVDAVLRGNKEASPGLMTYALRALLAWGEREFKPSAVRLRVFEDNSHAIAFYEKSGFYPEKKVLSESGKTFLVMRYRARGAQNGINAANGGVTNE